MASLNPSTDIAGFAGTIYEGAMLLAREQTLMSKVVRTYGDRTGLTPRKNGQYGGATMNTIAETDDLVGQAFTPAVLATLTPSEAGAQYFLTDSRVETDPFNVTSDAQQDLAEAMATKIDTDLVGYFSSFTGGTVGGTSGTALITWASVFNAEAILRNQKAPYPYTMVLNPYQWNVLAKAASVASPVATNAAPSLLEAVNSMFYVKQIGGLYIFVSANVPIVGNASHGGMFSRDALALDMRRAPRLEVERDASRRGFELNMSAVYGVGVWRSLFGIDMYFDATAPTT